MQNTKRLVNLAPASLLGRVLLSAIFIIAGLEKIPGWTNTLGYMQAKGMRAASFFLVCTIVVEVLGGLSLLLGYRARVGALMLAIYLIPVSLIFHNFWMLSGPEAQMQFVNFLKNITIIGGLLGVVANGAGAWSIDSRHEKKLEVTKLRRVA